MARILEAGPRTLRFAAPFRISGYVFETWDVVEVRVVEDGHVGRGQGGGVYYLGDDVPNMLAAIESARSAIESGIDREELRAVMPAGGGRNAIDCALWDLDAAKAGKPVWQLAGLEPPRPLLTTFTLGADEPAAMAARAVELAEAKAVKIKLTGEFALDLARVRAIRAARPDLWLGVDGNQGFAREDLPELAVGLLEARVSLLEQPLPRGQEAQMEGLSLPLPVAADESLQTLADIAGAVSRFDTVNIKLDKCGGLTEGLLMVTAAHNLGLGVMVGCMGGTSLAMAPGFVLGQLCDIVDLDGPTILLEDPAPAASYSGGMIFAGPEVWGG